MNLLAIDIGGTSIKIAVFTPELKMITSHFVETKKFSSPPQMIDFLCHEIEKLKESHKIISCGIGVPGASDENDLIINIPNLPILRNINLKDELNSRASLPIYIDNDANCAALYELHFGVGKELNNFIYITLGTGIGGALILNKRLFKGDFSSAGEIGFLIINYLGKKKYLEDFIGRRAFLKYAKEKVKTSPGSSLKNINFDIKDISDSADLGDSLSVELMKYYGKILGIGLASAINLLGISSLVIGGGVSACSSIMYDSLAKEMRNSTLANISNNLIIKKSKLLGQVGLFGAGTLALLKKVN